VCVPTILAINCCHNVREGKWGNREEKRQRQYCRQ